MQIALAILMAPCDKEVASAICNAGKKPDMKVNLDTPQFVNAEAMRASGLSSATLQTWVNRGLLTPASEKNPGQGQRRLYSLKDLIWLAVMGRATEYGIPVSIASLIATGFGQMFAEPELDTETWRKQPQFGDWESMWFGVAKEESGRYYITGHPWAIRGDASEEHRHKFRSENRETVMVVVDLIGVTRPVIETVVEILGEHEKA